MNMRASARIGERNPCHEKCPIGQLTLILIVLDVNMSKSKGEAFVVFGRTLGSIFLLGNASVCSISQGQGRERKQHQQSPGHLLQPFVE